MVNGYVWFFCEGVEKAEGFDDNRRGFVTAASYEGVLFAETDLLVGETDGLKRRCTGRAWCELYPVYTEIVGDVESG